MEVKRNVQPVSLEGCFKRAFQSLTGLPELASCSRGPPSAIMSFSTLRNGDSEPGSAQNPYCLGTQGAYCVLCRYPIWVSETVAAGKFISDATSPCVLTGTL